VNAGKKNNGKKTVNKANGIEIAKNIVGVGVGHGLWEAGVSFDPCVSDGEVPLTDVAEPGLLDEVFILKNDCKVCQSVIKSRLNRGHE
jgi:hypothetical protein